MKEIKHALDQFRDAHRWAIDCAGEQMMKLTAPDTDERRKKDDPEGWELQGSWFYRGLTIKDLEAAQFALRFLMMWCEVRDCDLEWAE